MPKPFYPEESLEAHGVPPDAFNDPGCYALALDVPEDFDDLRDRWYAEYDVEPPAPLVNAVESGYALAYIGAAKRLCARLHDHVAGDVRQAGLLAVCPATELREVWRDSEPFEAETQYAYAVSADHPETAVYANGDWF